MYLHTTTDVARWWKYDSFPYTWVSMDGDALSRHRNRGHCCRHLCTLAVGLLRVYFLSVSRISWIYWWIRKMEMLPCGPASNSVTQQTAAVNFNKPNALYMLASALLALICTRISCFVLHIKSLCAGYLQGDDVSSCNQCGRQATRELACSNVPWVS